MSNNKHCLPSFEKDEYVKTGITNIYKWQCKNCAFIYDAYINCGNVKVCPICTKSRSTGEIEVYNYIQSLIPDVKVLVNDYTILNRKELDIYIPSLKLAFEYNGDYWHGNKPDGYHESKTQGCLSKGITLYHIWENKWKLHNDEVKLNILNLLTIAGA